MKQTLTLRRKKKRSKKNRGELPRNYLKYKFCPIKLK